MTHQELAIRFFLQLAVVLVACRAAGSLVARVGQPRVIGEMFAGIVLGPSLFGLLAPDVQSAVFPRDSLGVLSVVSQLGLVLYMFVVGTRVHTDFLRRAFKGALLISVTGIVAPFVLGAVLASLLFGDGRFFAAGVLPWQAMIYLGAAMSVTAFPVLARIIQERGIAGTTLGSLALAAGAADDAIAWCLLAVVLASFNADAGLAVTAIAGGAAYAVVVLTIVRRQLAIVFAGDRLEPAQLAGVLALLMAGAWFTDAIGVHAVFGAFLMGVAMPRTAATSEITSRVEPLTTVLLVPLFFAYSGLSTQLNLLFSRDLILLSAAVIVVASLGKGVACWAAARAAGRPNREAMAIGALMNARGLMELIILNIGLERGLITPTLFTVMVTMTLATTLAAGPLFQWAWRDTSEVPIGPGVRAH